MGSNPVSPVQDGIYALEKARPKSPYALDPVSHIYMSHVESFSSLTGSFFLFGVFVSVLLY